MWWNKDSQIYSRLQYFVCFRSMTSHLILIWKLASATKRRGASSIANYSNRTRNYTASSVNRLVPERTDAAWSGPGIRKLGTTETTYRRRGRCLVPTAATHDAAAACHRARSTAVRCSSRSIFISRDTLTTMMPRADCLSSWLVVQLVSITPITCRPYARLYKSLSCINCVYTECAETH